MKDDLINRDRLMLSLVFSDKTGKLTCEQMRDVLDVINDQLPALVEVIRCRDCRYKFGSCCDNFTNAWVKDDDYCSRGEWREDDYE